MKSLAESPLALLALLSILAVAMWFIPAVFCAVMVAIFTAPMAVMVASVARAVYREVTGAEDAERVIAAMRTAERFAGKKLPR